MAYWLAISTRKNWEIIREKAIFGASERQKKPLLATKPGDTIYFFQSRDPNEEGSVATVIGSGMVDSAPYYDETPVFDLAHAYKLGELFPNRVRLRALRFVEPVPFKPLVEQLEFITNKRNWAMHIRGRALVPVTENDGGVLGRTMGMDYK